MFNELGRMCLIWGVLSCLPGWTEETAVRISGVPTKSRTPDLQNTKGMLPTWQCCSVLDPTTGYSSRIVRITWRHSVSLLHWAPVAPVIACLLQLMYSIAYPSALYSQHAPLTLTVHLPYFCFVLSCSYRHRTKRRLLAHVSLPPIYSLVSCAKHGVCLYKLKIADGCCCVEGEWLFRCNWVDHINVHLPCLIRTFLFLYIEGGVDKLLWRQVASV